MNPFINHFDLTPYNTFGLRAFAAQGFELTQIEQLESVLSWSRQQKRWMVIGEGANILFCEDYDGLMVVNRLRGRKLIDSGDSWTVEAAAGENWHTLVQWLVEQGVGGLENLALIPGTVGAAPVQNIGAYGCELQQVCRQVHYFDMCSGRHVVLDADECQFGYRDSIFKRELSGQVIITSVTLSLPKAWKPSLRYGTLVELSEVAMTPLALFHAVNKLRQAKLPDPAKQGNAGSFFKNPVVSEKQADYLSAQYPKMPRYPDTKGCKLAAGWLIDRCGLKGKVIGGAKVHEDQALVLINTGGAIAQDILSLAKEVRQQVIAEFGVELVPEVRFIGRYGEVEPVATIEVS